MVLRGARERNAILSFGAVLAFFISGSVYSQIASQLGTQPPFTNNLALTTSVANPLSLQNGFNIVPAQNILNTFGIDPRFRLPQAQTWALGIQEQLPHGFLVETEYIGTKGTYLGVVEQPNRPPFGTSVLTAQDLLRIPDATSFSYESSQGDSIFHAGQVRFTRRFSTGVSGNLLYTFARNRSTMFRVLMELEGRRYSSSTIWGWNGDCRRSTNGIG